MKIFLRFLENFSLRTKLIIAFVLIALIPLGIVLYINNVIPDKTLRGMPMRACQGIAIETADSLDEFINQGLKNAEVARRVGQGLIPISGFQPRIGSGSELEADTRLNLQAIAALDKTYIASVGLMD